MTTFIPHIATPCKQSSAKASRPPQLSDTFDEKMSSYQSPVKGNQFAARDTMAEVAVFGEFLADGKGPGREPFDVPNGTQIA